MIEAQGFFGADIAALVYGRDDDPDELLASFSFDLAAAGFEPAGLLQRRKADASRAASGLDLILLPDARTISLGYGQPPDQSGFASSGAALAEASASLSRALRFRPDVLVVNRFGSSEIAGGGLLGVICEAVERDIPVLIAVPRALFTQWRVFSNGMSVKLDCDRRALDRWWGSVSKTAASGPSPSNFCDAFRSAHRCP